ncbi:MAG: ROK family protein [Bacteroidales bacterium]|nr:ROK family protein [Bacteroidales bacterium]
MSSKGAYRFLDVGGTFIKCSDGRTVPSNSGGTRAQIAEALRAAVGDTDGLDGIGVAIPGPFDFREGIFRMDHKFAAVKGLPFRMLSGVPREIPLRFLHDVHALLAGSMKRLDLRGNTALVTLGTGLGFGHALQGRIQENPMGSPARNLYNIPCQAGILEDSVSARGIRNLYARLTGDIGVSAYEVALRARAGDLAAMEAYSTTATVLGEYLAPVLEELGIDSLLFGGQVVKSFDLMERPLRNALEGIPKLERIAIAPEGAVYEGLATLFENN